MRTLCLNLNSLENPSIAESFLSFSPRVQFRDPGFVFADISETSYLFGGEQHLASEALKVSRSFFPESSIAIADTPWTAQALSEQSDVYISSPTEDNKELSKLPLESLKNLEGLIAWESTNQVEEIISFFKLLGLKSIGEIRNFQSNSFRERWGHTGETLWKRLHGLDRQVISPLLPDEALSEYVHLDFPVSLLPFLIHCVEKKVHRLTQRLAGRGEFLQKLRLHLYCEYSKKCHLIEIQPATPSRDSELFLKLIENKLLEVCLENPIREFEIEVQSCPEKIQQFDFFQPQTEDQEKLDHLVSLFNQSNISTGFFRLKDELLPEDCWEITKSIEADQVRQSELEFYNDAFKFKASYSQNIFESPRPTRILQTPEPISNAQVEDLHFISDRPIERIETGWWESSRGRDYYAALNELGELLWVFYDHIERSYFIHGYFD